ncbi:hypothetical protein [Bradyrhizobium sp. 40]|uniref:hypothetical protein n=1 Tax=Bradyrhizobium sp. 40 TaxID=2782674 RepID=UPI001FFF6002|nr:hypothetical protein [Bradyrhizobium sp. 40]
MLMPACSTFCHATSPTPKKPGARASRASSLIAGEQDIDQQDPERDRGQHDGRDARRNRLLREGEYAVATDKEQEPAQARLIHACADTFATSPALMASNKMPPQNERNAISRNGGIDFRPKVMAK